MEILEVPYKEKSGKVHMARQSVINEHFTPPTAVIHICCEGKMLSHLNKWPAIAIRHLNHTFE